MKAAILAAGEGRRFGKATEMMPKPLIEVAGKPLIVRLLESLPSNVDICIIVLGHLGHMIRDFLGDTLGRLKFVYVEQTLRGTAGALFSAGSILIEDPYFLVSGSDDIFGQGELDKLIAHCPSYGIYPCVKKPASHFGVRIDNEGYFAGFFEKADKKHNGYNVGVGAYCLPNSFFGQHLCLGEGGEYSLPHTLIKASFRLKTVVIKKWIPVK